MARASGFQPFCFLRATIIKSKGRLNREDADYSYCNLICQGWLVLTEGLPFHEEKRSESGGWVGGTGMRGGRGKCGMSRLIEWVID